MDKNTKELGLGTVAIDLDGVLAKYDGWKVHGRHNIGAPQKGAKEFVEAIRKKYRVTVFTCRTKIASSPDAQKYHDPAIWLRNIVIDWLEKHNIPYDNIYIGQGKPHAVYYIDDRGVRLNHKENPDAFADTLDFMGIKQ